MMDATPVEPGRAAAARDAAVPPPRRRSRWVLWVTVPLILMVLAGVGGWIAVERSVDRRLAEAIAATDRADPHWRLDDLLAHRAPIAAGVNSADVAAGVRAQLPDGWPPSTTVPPGTPRPGPDAVNQAYTRLVATKGALRLDDPMVQALRDGLAPLAGPVAQARTLAEGRIGRHAVQVTANPIEIPLKETQAAREVARLLAADSAVLAHEGKIDEALGSASAILGVGRSIGDEPFLISGLVRIAVGSSGLQAIRRVLGQGEPTDAALARLQAIVLDERTQPFMQQAIRGERAIMDETIRRISAGTIPIAALTGGPVDYVPPWTQLAFDHQRAIGLEWMNRLVTILALPPKQRPPLLKEWDAERARAMATPFTKLTAMLPLLMIPAVAAASDAQARYQTEMGAMAILLAAERHRLKHGAWPESIAAIDPAILPTVPLDPFTEQPYRLARPDGQFLVHSVGPNLKDEQGEYQPRAQGGPDDFGSAAWDVSRRRQPPEEPPDEPK